MTMSPPPPPTTTHIPLPYCLFHLYIEPLVFVPGGIYLSLFRPRQFLLSTVPSPLSLPYSPSLASPEPITPLHRILLTNTAALYILFMLNELLVLRLSDDIRVWRAVVFAMLCCDLVHLYGVWVASGGAEFMLSPGQWMVEEWVNTGILLGGAVLRGCFLVGVGVREGEGDKGLDKRE
jgi:hypothetical protein